LITPITNASSPGRGNLNEVIGGVPPQPTPVASVTLDSNWQCLYLGKWPKSKTPHSGIEPDKTWSFCKRILIWIKVRLA